MNGPIWLVFCVLSAEFVCSVNRRRDFPSVILVIYGKLFLILAKILNIVQLLSKYLIHLLLNLNYFLLIYFEILILILFLFFRFVGHLLKLLVCNNEKFGNQIQKHVKELVGHEMSPLLYPILFDQIKLIIDKFFDQQGMVSKWI